MRARSAYLSQRTPNQVDDDAKYHKHNHLLKSRSIENRGDLIGLLNQDCLRRFQHHWLLRSRSCIDPPWMQDSVTPGSCTVVHGHWRMHAAFETASAGPHHLAFSFAIWRALAAGCYVEKSLSGALAGSSTSTHRLRGMHLPSESSRLTVPYCTPL